MRVSLTGPTPPPEIGADAGVTDAGADTAAPDDGGGLPTRGSCGCALAATTTDTSFVAFAYALLGLFLIRRRRRR